LREFYAYLAQRTSVSARRS